MGAALNPISEGVSEALGTQRDREVKTIDMNNDGVKALFISDIHLGHHRVHARDTIEGLRKVAFPNTTSMSDIDIIFIAGDFFDRNLHLSANSVGDIQLFIKYLLKLCAQHNIILRLLEGTPSHDWKQGILFEQIIALSEMEESLNFKWVKTLSIEHIEELKMDVLYIPDEWDPDPNNTWKQVKSALHDRGLEQVDFTIMHGMFEFQLPKGVNITHHLSERYLGITRHYISIGHHHTQRSFDRILVQGSFDRLCHGEEGDKGFYRVEIRPDGNNQIQFVANPYATRFDTIRTLGLEFTEAMEIIKARVDSLPEGSHVRIVADRNSPLSTSKHDLEIMYDRIFWTIVREDTGSEQDVQQDLQLVNKVKAARLDAETAPRLVEDKLGHLDEDKRRGVLQLLERCK